MLTLTRLPVWSYPLIHPHGLKLPVACFCRPVCRPQHFLWLSGYKHKACLSVFTVPTVLSSFVPLSPPPQIVVSGFPQNFCNLSFVMLIREFHFLALLLEPLLIKLRCLVPFAFFPLRLFKLEFHQSLFIVYVSLISFFFILCMFVLILVSESKLHSPGKSSLLSF